MTEAVAVPPNDDTDVLYRDLFFQDFNRLVKLARFLGADDPEDIVQEAFVRLHARLLTIRRREAVRSYLTVTVVRLVRSRQRHLAVAAATRSRVAVRDQPSSTDPASLADSMAVEQMVAGLPRRQREVIVLRYWLDLDERAIAKTLGISVGSVKTHASRAIARLARDWEGERK